MPMNQNSTPVLTSPKKVKRAYAQPSQGTLDFLRNFARTYVPGQNPLESKVEMFLN